MQVDPLLPLPVIGAMAAIALVSVAPRLRRGAPTLAIVRTVAMILLATAIAVDPTLPGGSSEARRAAADVLFVVDSTSSMAALDFDGDSPRLDGVRADIRELAAEFPGAHFSLVRFDSQARVELPWTTDLGALETAVSVLRQERAVYSRGSRLDQALDAIDQQLPRPGRSGGADRDSSYSVIFYFSDGEQRRDLLGEAPRADPEAGLVLEDDQSTETITSFAELAPDVDAGAVFGYGTAAGAPMIEFVGRDQLFTADDSPFVIDYATNTPAVSRFSEESLVEIAGELGLPYLHRAEPGGLAAVASAIADAAPTVSDGSRDTPRRLYWIPALALLAVVLWQIAVTSKEALVTRQLLGGPAQRVVAPAAAPDQAWTTAGKESAA